MAQNKTALSSDDPKVSFDPHAASKQTIGVNRNLNLNLLLGTLTGVAVGF